MRPRLLRIITRLNVGGPATHVILANRGLEDRGWETLLVFGTVEPDEAEVAIPTDLMTRRIPSLQRAIRPPADLRAAAAIGRAIRGFRPHLIHTHLSKAGLLGRSVATVTSRAPLVHTFHGNVFGGYFGPSASRSIRAAERILARRTAAIVALSNRQKIELLDAGVGDSGRIRVIPLGLDLGRFAPDVAPSRKAARRDLGIAPEELVFAAIGRLVPIKRLELLLRAFAAFAPSTAGARLYLIGDGSERRNLEELAVALAIRERVSFVGWSTDTPRWYAASDVICLTSEREGTPLALIEAAAAGRPAIATDVGGVADVILDGETGLVVSFGDVDAFAAAMRRLATDASLRARATEAGPTRARRYDGNRLVADLDGLYRDLLGGPEGR